VALGDWLLAVNLPPSAASIGVHLAAKKQLLAARTVTRFSFFAP
jgi:hypothetical protein